MNEISQPERIKSILDAFDDITVRKDTLLEYLAFLSDNISMPCEVVTTGEYERYQLDALEDSNDELFGLLGKVTLVSDETKCTKIPLCDLKAVDNRSHNFVLLNDYATWFINHQ